MTLFSVIFPKLKYLQLCLLDAFSEPSFPTLQKLARSEEIKKSADVLEKWHKDRKGSRVSRKYEGMAALNYYQDQRTTDVYHHLKKQNMFNQGSQGLVASVFGQLQLKAVRNDLGNGCA